MKKTALETTLILVLMFSAATGSQSITLATAQTHVDITISADGSTHPANALQRTGNVYSLASDIIGTITVNASNIVLEGNKHHLSAPSISNYCITLNATSNVTVTNFKIIGGAKGIDITGTSNTIKNNTITETDNGIYSLSQPTAAIMLNNAKSNTIIGNNLENSKVGIDLVSWNPKQCSNNKIVENNFINCSIAILVYDSSNNSFYHNNFLNNAILLEDNGYSGYSLPSFNVWDDGQQFGNYWSDYQTRYPDSKEIDSTGVGDTPYFVKPNGYVELATLTRQEAIDHWREINAQYQENTDQHPLMMAYGAFPLSTPTSPLEPTPTSPPPLSPFPTPTKLIIGSAIAVAVVVGLGLLVYFKKHHSETGAKTL